MSKYIEWQTNSIINYVQIICAHTPKKKKKRMNTKEYSREMVDKLDEKKNIQIKTIIYLFRCLKHSFIFQNLTYNTIQQLREKER